MALTIRERFAAISPDATLTVDTIAVDLDRGIESWIRLRVDDAPFAALPRDEFLARFALPYRGGARTPREARPRKPDPDAAPRTPTNRAASDA
jgi:hypothetical protein